MTGWSMTGHRVPPHPLSVATFKFLHCAALNVSTAAGRVLNSLGPGCSHYYLLQHLWHFLISTVIFYSVPCPSCNHLPVQAGVLAVGQRVSAVFVVSDSVMWDLLGNLVRFSEFSENSAVQASFHFCLQNYNQSPVYTVYCPPPKKKKVMNIWEGWSYLCTIN